MSLELTLLRLCRDRQRFYRLAPTVPKEGLESSTMTILRGLKRFYADFPEVQKLDMDAFVTWMQGVFCTSLPQDRLEVVKLALTNMRKEVPPEMEEGMTGRLLSVAFASDANALVKRFSDGEEVDVLRDMQGLTEVYETRMKRQTRMPEVSGQPEDLIAEDMDDRGLKFRLACLSDNMRGLRGGDFGIIAARPDAGKTTLLCSESAHWITQLDALWPGEERCGIWLNNEGPGNRIRKRWYQSVLGMTTLEIAELVERGRMEGRNLFTEALVEKLGMPLNRMRFFDIHDMYSDEVERIIKMTRPGFVIFDMMDNIKFRGLTANGGERTDQILEAQYQAGRNWCVKYDCIGVATSQLSADAEGIKHPGQHMLKDSKTGKQGACDFIVTMGKDNEPVHRNSRWINTPKNKLVRPGKRTDPRAEVVFDADHALVLNPQP